MRRRTIHMLTASAVALAALALPLRAVDAEAVGATIDKTGWWSQLTATIATPAGPIAAPAPQVPEGSLTTASNPGEPTAIAAVGIVPDAPAGSTVLSASLTLVEDDTPTGVGEDIAAIAACPITEFWVGGENSEWDQRPTFDCSLAAAIGERDADAGTWTFDLTEIGALWLDATSGVRPDGVALVPDPEADPSGYQVIWEGDSIDVAFSAVEPEGSDEDPFAFAPTTPTTPTPTSSGSGGGGSSFTPPPANRPVATTPTTAPAPAAPPTTVAETTAEPIDEQAAPQPISTSRAGDILGNLPAAVLLLFPLAGLVLLAMSYWLGVGQPATATVERRGGVSRALEARARAAQER